MDTYQRVQKYLVTLTFPPEAQVDAGSTLARDGKQVGSVTSVTRLPDGEQLIGLGYVRKASAEAGVRLELEEPATGWAEVRDLPQLFGPRARLNKKGDQAASATSIFPSGVATINAENS